MSAPALETPRSRAEDLRVEATLFAFALFAYALSSWGMLLHQSNAPHFVWQADAFLHGQLHLRAQPPNLNDWVFEGGRWYVSFPPFPAVLMMPFVAIAGLGFDDTAFTVMFAALNVALIYRVLRVIDEESPRPRTSWENAAHALVFGFGTLAWSCGIRGEVWFTAETIGVTLTLLYLLSAVRARHPVWAGLFLACATITRTPLAFSVVFFVLEAFLAPLDATERAARKPSLAGLAHVLRDPSRRGVVFRKLALFAVPLALVGAAMAWANWTRFGSPGEFGHSHLYANRVNADIQRFGLFHYAYLERNLHAAFTRLPQISFHPLRIGYDAHGMSLLVTTPLFAYLLWPAERPRLHRALWLTVAAVSVPGFFYQNDGWQQFGFRFSLDYTPYLVVLLALGRRALTPTWWAVALAGVAVNAWGAAVFNRFF